MNEPWQVILYVVAVLVPLAAFVVELFGGRLFKRTNALIATGAIGFSFVLSLVGLVSYFSTAEGVFTHHPAQSSVAVGTSEAKGEHSAEHDGEAKGHSAKAHSGPLAWTGGFDWVALGGDAISGDVRGKLSNINLTIPIGVYIDNLTVIMFSMVTFIATLVHIYSMGYMSGDKRYPLFFTYLSLFCFSMLGLLVSSSIFMVFVFWELVGVCSYLLIGFWYEDKKNCDAANKAFITNRVGDVGMLVGLGLIWSCLGTFDIAEINRTIIDSSGHQNVKVVDGHEVVQLTDPNTHQVLKEPATDRPRQITLWVLTIAGLGIFAGCAGKSAQFPLHVWLPDAMAGPTPVSALIHAATMVAAGVYLVGRFFPLFTETALLCIAYTGGITLFIAASIAMVQNDYKKVLAYSTVSQLGFMMLGLGVGGRAAGLFHLVTHAFFKALLFLGAGSVFHAVHTCDMSVLGGLYKKMKWTALTMLAATLAISGVPGFSGFYSKDAILAASIHFVFEEGKYEHILLFLLPTIGAAMTAFYMFRMWFLVFGGESRGYSAAAIEAHESARRAAAAEAHDDHGHASGGHGDDHGPLDPHPAKHAHESGPLMLWPLFALAIPTIAIGWPAIVLPAFGFHPILEQLIEYGEPVNATDMSSSHLLALGASLLIATFGIGLGFLYYSPWAKWRKFNPAKTAARFAPIDRFLIHKWYFDELYAFLFIRPTLRLARGVSWIDKNIVDAVVNGAARSVAGLSKLEGIFDRIAIDRLVNEVARATFALGERSRLIQTGKIRNYLMVLAIGVVGLFAGLLAWILSLSPGS